MILWGTFASSWRVSLPNDRPLTLAWAMNGCGALICLYVFMADSLKVASGGPPALRYVLPFWFNWPLFLAGLAGMAAPVVQTGFYLLKYRERQESFIPQPRWMAPFDPTCKEKENL
jgi:hypothetical protein